MTQYHVDAAEVAAASGRAATSADTIRAEAAAMLAHLTSLESTWRGGAATAFADVLQQWRGAQLHVEQALDVITAALAQAADQYETAEQNAARLFVR